MGPVLGAGLMALGCGYSEEAMQAERDRVASLSAELNETQQRVRALEAENEALEERMEELQRQRERERAECERLREGLEELRALEEDEP